MAQCKLNKISIVCEKWKRKNIKSDSAMQEIQNILDLKESEMPPCTCKETTACPMKPKAMPSCPMKPNAMASCPIKPNAMASCPTEKSGSCHTPGPTTINPFFNFMKELRETTCFNKTATEVSIEAGERWSKMSECEKAKYIVEAYKVSRKKDGYLPKRRNSGSA